MNTLPRILFFNINGSGMGHMNRCLSYARPLRGKAEVTFFSLASAIEVIENMGGDTPFDAEYYVSQFWTTSNNYTWNTELAFRLPMVLEHVQPHVIVFDGTWPYQGFLTTCKTYGKAKLVWSHRGLFKESARKCPVHPSHFDLILEPGELMHEPDQIVSTPQRQHNKLCLSPVTLLNDEEILSKADARKELNLEPDTKYALLSLGPGNLKDVHSIGYSCIELLQEQGYSIVWACPPISVKDVPLPQGIIPLTYYPLVKILRAFDVFVGAAGYNTCCEVVQAQVPTILIPNTQLVDDQSRRAHLVVTHAPAMVCMSEKKEDLRTVLYSLMALQQQNRPKLCMQGGEEAAKALLQLALSVQQDDTLPQQSWTSGPSWQYILKYTCKGAALQHLLWHKILFPFFNAWGMLKHRYACNWRGDLKHAPNEHGKKVLLWMEGLPKEHQRTLCQVAQDFFAKHPQYTPILVTDTPDFAFFSRLQWLIEYLPVLRKRQDADYKAQKRAYIRWRYADATLINVEKLAPSDAYFTTFLQQKFKENN